MSQPERRTARHALRDLLALRTPGRAAFVARYFKTGPGQYGYGDRFPGLTLPQIRRLPRTALRYAIERFPPRLRRRFLELE